MYTTNLQKGQSLMEILFAIAIFTTGFMTIGYLIIDAQQSLQRNIDFAQARLLAYEGVEATRSIRDRDFSALTVGTHGLVLDGNLWKMSIASSTPISKFNRSLTIRDLSNDQKEVTSSVVWDQTTSMDRKVSFTAHLSNWRGVHGESSSLVIFTGSTTLSGDGTKITSLLLSNKGSEPITLSDMVLTWNTGATIERVTINGTDVYARSTSSETGILSATPIVLNEQIVPGNEGSLSIDAIAFSSSVIGTRFTFTGVMGDGSSQSTSLNF